jgi:alkylation response protein AidB-like acyl-CoA dehydrogenase
MTGATMLPTDREELRAHLLGAVDAISGTLADCADQAEREGRYPERGWRALHDAGLFRVKSPRELGGAEADPVTQIEVIERLAYIDTTAAWTQFVGAGTLSIVAAWLPDAGLEQYLVDGRLPRTAGGVAAAGEAVPVEGGYRLTGRWPFASGCYHAEWLSGTSYIAGADPVAVLGFAFPREAVTIHDTWDVSSLKGTGSADISVQDLFVPTEHTFDNFAPAARGGPLYAITLPGFVANEHGAFALGAARRAVDEVVALAKTKTRGYVIPQGVAGREKFQWDLGRTEVALRSARAGLVAVNEEAWQAASSGAGVGVALQTELRGTAVHATEVALDAVRTMFRYAGAKSLYTGNIIDRCLRDVTAASQHGIVNDVSYELHGQAVLGLQDIAPLS